MRATEGGWRKLLRPLTLACVFGCAGLAVTDEEAAFFKAVRPGGFILFGRNVGAPDQVRSLVAALRAAADRPDAPVMIDQEGGRVRRLRPPHWRAYPPARAYGVAGRDGATAQDLAWLGGRLMAEDLVRLGVNINCAPVLDVPALDGHEIIGDRAFGATADQITPLARAMAEGLLAGGVLPVIKHMPGHGRAREDSHVQLPVVEASRAELAATDLRPFVALSDMPIAMTAHVVYTAIDADRPCTTSAAVISELIRGEIGFDGLLIGDDLSMSALAGTLGERAAASLDAGCDLVLHCNGDLEEMKVVAANARELTGLSAGRAAAAFARLGGPVDQWDGRQLADAANAFQAAFDQVSSR